MRLELTLFPGKSQMSKVMSQMVTSPLRKQRRVHKSLQLTENWSDPLITAIA